MFSFLTIDRFQTQTGGRTLLLHPLYTLKRDNPLLILVVLLILLIYQTTIKVTEHPFSVLCQKLVEVEYDDLTSDDLESDDLET